jgi:hypothetical protein
MPRVARTLLDGFLLPALLYLALYYAFTYPLLHSFNTHYFCGTEDGYQNIWNLWWLNKSIAELHQLPWHTTWLHYPAGTSLVAHTLAPFNGVIAVPMLQLGFSLNQAYNTVVFFSFVMSGVTTFWLARRVTGSYAGALFAGAAFTFCHFHFAHAQNHLQVTSIEWLPLAILAVYELLTRPTMWKGAGAAGAFWLVTLVDFHFAFYVVLAGAILGIFLIVRLRKAGFERVRSYIGPLVVFVALTLATTGPLAFQLLRLNRTDRLQQNHDPAVWSTDVIDPAIPGAQWRFNRLTAPVWSTLAKPHEAFVYVEHSLYVGWSVVLLLAYAYRHSRTLPLAHTPYWFALLVAFFLFSLGPWLHVAGRVTSMPGPYHLLELLIPPLKIGGVPMRMMAVVYLAAAMIAAGAIAHLLKCGSRGRAVAMLIPLLALWVIETLPKPQPTTPAVYPAWVTALRDLPAGAVLDTTFLPDMQVHLYYATGHGKPVGEGYISRYPESVERRRGHLRELLLHRDFETLRRGFGFRYLVVTNVNGRPSLEDDGGAPRVPYPTVYKDAGATIYDLRK